MNRAILMVEPFVRSKFPPLGLMKISTYHKLRGDSVHFVMGCDKKVRLKKWDRIYVSSLFTWNYKTTVEAIRFYSASAPTPADVYTGGVLASLMPERIHTETGATVMTGLLSKPGALDKGSRRIIDTLTPDYDLLSNHIDHYNGLDAYYVHATRGCPNRCGFCAVPRLEGAFAERPSLLQQVRDIEQRFGPRQDLILLDNNVLNSSCFNKIIDDILKLGFEKGAKRNNRLRFVDFNQGVDVRLLTDEKMKRLAETAIRPLRIAFDHIDLKGKYVAAIRMACKYGVLNLSNYVLYNYQDNPRDFYDRLRVNVELNQKIGSKIYSFPMKYVPLDALDRTYIGKNWEKKWIRSIQCILLATFGKVGLREDFFDAAFGRDFDEFEQISSMPEKYIIYRNYYEKDAAKWKRNFSKLSTRQRVLFIKDISSNKVSKPSSASALYKKMYAMYYKIIDVPHLT